MMCAPKACLPGLAYQTPHALSPATHLCAASGSPHCRSSSTAVSHFSAALSPPASSAVAPSCASVRGCACACACTPDGEAAEVVEGCVACVLPGGPGAAAAAVALGSAPVAVPWVPADASALLGRAALAAVSSCGSAVARVDDSAGHCADQRLGQCGILGSELRSGSGLQLPLCYL